MPEKAGCSEDVVVAGLLHDILEDTDTSPTELMDRFRLKIYYIVNNCTESHKSLPWEERKRDMLDWLASASPEVRAVAVADKLDNIQEIARDIKELGDDLWKRFNAGKDSQARYYREMVKILCSNPEDELDDELRDMLQELFKKRGSLAMGFP